MRLRRSRADLRLANELRIGQAWRPRSGGPEWIVVQIHRADCVVGLGRGRARLFLRFAQLREDWTRTELGREGVAA